jgi:hypothetical protein
VNTSLYSRQWDVGSFTDQTKKPYKVSERRDGRWECSCPAWTRHTPRTDCKHIRKVQGALRIAPAVPMFSPAAPSQPPVSKPQACDAITFEGYTIRRRPLVERFDDDMLTGADTATATTRSRRDI